MPTTTTTPATPSTPPTPAPPTPVPGPRTDAERTIDRILGR